MIELPSVVTSTDGKDAVLKAVCDRSRYYFFGWKKDFGKLGLNFEYKEKCIRNRDKRGTEGL